MKILNMFWSNTFHAQPWGQAKEKHQKRILLTADAGVAPQTSAQNDKETK